MDKPEFKKLLKELFESKELSIVVDVEIQEAQAGIGVWNVTKTRVMLDNEMIMEEQGSCEICFEPR